MKKCRFTTIGNPSFTLVPAKDYPEPGDWDNLTLDNGKPVFSNPGSNPVLFGNRVTATAVSEHMSVTLSGDSVSSTHDSRAESLHWATALFWRLKGIKHSASASTGQGQDASVAADVTEFAFDEFDIMSRQEQRLGWVVGAYVPVFKEVGDYASGGSDNASVQASSALSSWGVVKIFPPGAAADDEPVGYAMAVTDGEDLLTGSSFWTNPFSMLTSQASYRQQTTNEDGSTQTSNYGILMTSTYAAQAGTNVGYAYTQMSVVRLAATGQSGRGAAFVKSQTTAFNSNLGAGSCDVDIQDPELIFLNDDGV